jgi:hypothetical protein
VEAARAFSEVDAIMVRNDAATIDVLNDINESFSKLAALDSRTSPLYQPNDEFTALSEGEKLEADLNSSNTDEAKYQPSFDDHASTTGPTESTTGASSPSSPQSYLESLQNQPSASSQTSYLESLQRRGGRLPGSYPRSYLDNLPGSHLSFSPDVRADATGSQLVSTTTRPATEAKKVLAVRKSYLPDVNRVFPRIEESIATEKHQHSGVTKDGQVQVTRQKVGRRAAVPDSADKARNFPPRDRPNYQVRWVDTL